MATLESVQGASLVPQFGPLGDALGGLLKGQQVEQAQQKLFKPGATKEQVSQGLLTLNRLDPQAGQFALQVFERGDDLEIKKLRGDAKREAARAQAVKNIKDPAKRRMALLDIANEDALIGKDPGETLRMTELSDDALDLELDTDILIGQTFGAVFKPQEQFDVVDVNGQPVQKSRLTGELKSVPGAQKAQSPVGKIESDLRAKLISPTQAQQANALLNKASKEGNFVTSPTFLTREDDGSNSISVPITNKRTGETTVNKIPISGNIIERAGGQTPQEEASLKVQTAGRTAGATREVERVTAAPIAAEKKRGGSEEKRAQENISGGLLAASALPQLQRSLSLLNEVETGGLAAVNIKARRLLGIESADEGELSFNLSKNVMRQLKPTFGAAFTEREGALLTAIEAGITKSPAGNKRLLRQAIKITRNAIERGQRAALNRGDQEALRDITEAMSLDLSPEGLVAEPAPTTALEDLREFQGAGASGPGEFNFNPESGRLERVR
jgi:hypothetical protein